MKLKSEKDYQPSDFWIKLDVNVGFFITNFSYFFYDWVLGEEMSLFVTFLDGLKMFTSTIGGTG